METSFKKIRPIDIPDNVLEQTVALMRAYPEYYGAYGPIDPSEVDTDTAADFICKYPWRFVDLEDGVFVW